jgi:hypothetical protein
MYCYFSVHFDDNSENRKFETIIKLKKPNAYRKVFLKNDP